MLWKAQDASVFEMRGKVRNRFSTNKPSIHAEILFIISVVHLRVVRDVICDLVVSSAPASPVGKMSRNDSVSRDSIQEAARLQRAAGPVS